jgi:hypothetical protein
MKTDSWNLVCLPSRRGDTKQICAWYGPQILQHKGGLKPETWFEMTENRGQSMVSFETSFDAKQTKLEPKLVSALSETNCLFWLFCFYSIPKRRFSMFRLNRNKQKTNRNSLIWSIFWYFFRKFRVFPVFSVCFEIVRFGCFASLQKQRISMFRLNRNKQKTNRNSLIVWYF